MAATLVELSAGKIAAVLTALEMTARPAPRPEPDGHDFSLELVTDPDPGWYRALFRRVGTEWLWFSRLRVDDRSLAAILRHKQVEVHVAPDHRRHRAGARHARHRPQLDHAREGAGTLRPVTGGHRQEPGPARLPRAIVRPNSGV
jgi:hypothetical protein